MKRLVFYSILILVFLATCKPYEPEEEKNTPDTERPAVNHGTGSVTVYLDGNGRAASRAMNKTFAEMGCDYFEVVFKYNKNNNGEYETAIGQWKIGERAGVSGVWRETGVDYTGVSFAPVQGKGSAILLAGKSDRTIMGIGKLSLVDGKPVSSLNLIDLNTVSVTFDVAAIKTGVNPVLESSSFLTAAGSAAPGTLGNVSEANTLTTAEEIMSLYFFAFKLTSGVAATKAVYKFQLHSGTAGDYTNFGDYVTTGGGLRVAAKGTAERKHPAYTTPDGAHISDSVILLDERTGVIMDNNQTAHAEFKPDVEFTFNTSLDTGTKLGSIFALVFEIPVYALDTRCGWFIRPGYGVLKYELDRGDGGMGGAVLIKTGELVITVPTDDFKIEIKRAPDKWRYRWTGTINGKTASTSEYTLGVAHDIGEYNRVFNTDGLKVQMQDGDGRPYLTNHYPYEDMGVFLSTNPGDPDYCIIDPARLTYIVGRERINTGDLLDPEFYGLVEVTVRFTDRSSGVPADDYFFILVSGTYYIATGSNIHNSTNGYDYANIADIRGAVGETGGDSATFIAPISANPDQARNDFMGAVQNASGNNSIRTNRIAIIRLTGSFDIAAAALNVNANIGSGISDSTLIMIVATNASGVVTLGRLSAGGSFGERINIRGARSGLTAFYFGKWPFAGLIHSPAALANTKRFIVNPGGTVASAAGGPDAAPLYNNKMITDGTTADRTAGIGGGIYNVDIDPKKYDLGPSGIGDGYPHNYESGVEVYRQNLLH